MDLNNKTVILTGAASGIGFEILLKLQKFSSKIIAVDLNADKIKISSRFIEKYKCDLSDKKETDQLFRHVEKKYGKIDLFIANAGFAYYEKIGQPDWNHIEKIFSINTFSPIYCAEKMRLMNGNRPFNFVLTSSAIGYLSLPGYALYSSTKAAIRAFSESYRFELEKGQVLQVIFPIATKTNFFKAAGDSPVPFPSQKAETVAKNVIRGIQKNKKSIYPSALFHSLWIANRVIPFIMPLIQLHENRNFRKWLAGKK